MGLSHKIGQIVRQRPVKCKSWRLSVKRRRKKRVAQEGRNHRRTKNVIIQVARNQQGSLVVNRAVRLRVGRQRLPAIRGDARSDAEVVNVAG